MQRIKKGDTVEVIAGRDIGEKGQVVQVLVKDNRVIVEGVNKEGQITRLEKVIE